jgi:hypothetical protein
MEKGSYLTVDPSHRHSVRVVVQRIYSPGGFFYRLVAYGDGQTYRPTEFGTLEQLEEALRSVAPNFNGIVSAETSQAQHTSIIFSREMELDDSQLSRLGLKQDAAS